MGAAACSYAQIQDPPQWNTTDTFQAGGIVRASNGNYYRATHTTVNKDPTKDAHVNWELYYVRASMSLTVAASGGTFNNLQAAFQMASSATIASTASVTISINTSTAVFNQSFSSPFNLDATSGARISIAGDNRDRVLLKFTGATDGFVIDDAHTLGGFSGLSIIGSASSVDGVHATGASKILGSDLVVSGFKDDVVAEERSYVACGGSSIGSFTQGGVVSITGSMVDCHGSAIDGLNGASNGQVGVDAERQSRVDARSSSVHNCAASGYRALILSSIDASSARAVSATVGFDAESMSNIMADRASATSNKLFGYFVAAGSTIQATNTTNAQNAHDFSLVPNSPNSTLCVIIQ